MHSTVFLFLLSNNNSLLSLSVHVRLQLDCTMVATLTGTVTSRPVPLQFPVTQLLQRSRSITAQQKKSISFYLLILMFSYLKTFWGKNEYFQVDQVSKG